MSKVERCRSSKKTHDAFFRGVLLVGFLALKWHIRQTGMGKVVAPWTYSTSSSSSLSSMTLRPSAILSETHGNGRRIHSRERTGSGLLFLLFGCRFRRRSTTLGPEEVSNIRHGGDVEKVLVVNWVIFGCERRIYQDPFSFVVVEI